MIFDGKTFAKQLEKDLKQQLQQTQLKPKILSLLIGQDPASLLYTRLKQKAAQRVGLNFQVLHLQNSKKLTSQDIINQINSLESQFSGIMVQLPLPNHLKLSTHQILQAIPLAKDVDGLRWQESGMMPATVRAIISTLENIQTNYQSNLWHQQFAVIGSQGAVGKPLVHFLKQKTTNIFEIDLETKKPKKFTNQADVVISCTGQPHLIKPNWVKPGLISIDVGISKVNGKIAGDFDPKVYQLSSLAVPVPGGIGPVTIISLLKNSLELLVNKKPQTKY